MALEPVCLSQTVDAIGTPLFGQRLMEFVSKLAPVDKCTAFAFRAGEPPRAVIAEGVDEHFRNLAHRLADDYVAGAFEWDPNLARARSVVEGRPATYFLKPRQLENCEFKRRFYVEPEIRQEFSMIFRGRDVLYFFSLFRGADLPEFADRQICLLRQTLPLLESLVSKHFFLTDAQATVGQRPPPPSSSKKPSVAHVRGLFLRAAGHLTPREAEVVAMITLGNSAEAISDALGISVNTACTHRKRSYAKLGIASQSDLFSLYFELSGT